jgi:hypothetical protein
MRTRSMRPSDPFLPDGETANLRGRHGIHGVSTKRGVDDRSCSWEREGLDHERRRGYISPARRPFGKLLADIGKLPKKLLYNQLLRWGMV